MNRWQAVLIGLVTLGSTQAAKSDDLVSDLPGLTFNPTFAQYSGFLDASAGNHLHYWLVEAQTSPQWAPLVLWLNGGPGCSSLLGLLTENGPFRVGADGASLVENPHSWNKAANMLFLEAPRDVGFSYRDNATYGYDSVYNDEKTANDNALALIQFFTRFPEYQGRDFYITGESYGGVYVPTLTKKIVELIKNNTTPYINLKGFAVGNGALSRKQLTNSAVDLLYYRGMLGVSQWEDLRQCCPDTPQGPLVDCDFSQFVYIDEFGNPNPRNDTNDPQAIKCGQMVTDLSMNAVWMTYNDVYNTYQDCYNFTGTKQEGINQVIHKKTYNHLLKSALGSMASVVSSSSYNMFSSGVNPFVDQGSRINQQSTDSLNGWSCFSDDYVAAYLARSDVRNALHIPTSVQQWQSCSDAINGQYYIQQTPDLTDTFKYLIDSSYPLKALIYNGDVDLACNYLGDQWFVESLATKTYNFTITRKRTQWTYKRASKYQPQLAGYVKSWNYNQFNIDLLTVKGGGHMVPTDRPGPALQMFYNFIYKTGYNTLVPYSLTTQDLKSDYTSAPSATWTRKQADRVWNLPGLTFNLNFKQYSGYLNGVTGNYLHYWFLESQSNPQTDPLVLWLTGGPGCSGLMALLIELGPFRPNPDGKTLFENVYSWNKMANVLFLESPRGVGFSVQDFTLNNDTVYDDERTARDTLLALKDFFTVYPEYSGRQFFVTGESYGGVYVPTITSLLVDEILAKRFPELNLIGFSVGNGELSAIHNLNSLIQLSYFHGLFGKEEWDSLQQCCNSTKDAPTWLEYCDFTQHVYFGSDGGPIPRRNDFCGNKVVDLQNRVWGSLNNVYNIYQDCYQRTTPDAGLAAPKYMGFIDQGAKISTYSTDSQGGILCYYADGSASYLNEADVRSALHVSPNAANWTACNDVVNENYIQQNNDTGKVFEHMINSGYPLRVLIYNGDVDQACNFLGDQWFIESLTTRNGFSVTKARDAWRYQTQIAGYGKTFDNDKGFKIDLLTVKGGGHMVPTDRPGPALQMITNFFRNQDYNNPVNVDTTLHPLNTQYVVAEQLTQQQNGTNPAFSQTVRNVKKNRIQAKRRRVKARNQLAQNSDANEKVRAAAPPPPSNTTKDQDLITSLPGLTYTPNFKQYSGYLPASTGNYLHYWLTESQLNTSDPLILWLNGGPGCSSLGGFFEELGPFHVNADGETLFENVFSWNKAGNVLFLEAPRGVGFSYRSNEVPDDGMYNDTYTAADTILALQAFFTKFPEYQGRDFYITGESYGGIYVPTLTDALIKQIQSGAMSYVNFVGIAIGNGELSEVQQINSAISLLYFRGDSDKSDYDALSQCCDTSKPQAYCDFSQYYYLDTAGNAWPKKTDGSVEAVCGTLAVQQGFYNVWETDNDVYNTFQDCYDSTANVERIFETSGRRTKRSTGDVSPLLPNPLFVDQAKKVNYKSTDNNGGFSCFGGASAENYLNLQSVRDAIHIPSAFTTHWTDCNDDMNEHYVQQHNDTTSVFQSIIASGYKLNILIYNGDVDMACQFLGDQWFIENLATVNNAQVSRARDQWNYTQNQYQPQIGGYWKQFNFNNGQITLDQLTVKGAGHFVPQDRPGPALQMIYNFVNKLDYNRNLTLDITPSPLLDAYTPAPVTVVRRKADRISALPGLTFKPTFDHHSGYLSSETGESLFYWLVESQTKGTNDPVILWLQGGPGCASTGGLLGEIGPFYVNPDGETIFENIYAWNKAAYVVVIDSPRSIGFSYQDTNVNNDTKWDDDKTANATASALEDFFVAFPQFKHRDFYIAGESYGGVYIPTLTRVLVNRIQSGQSSINLKGIMIGNGMVSAVQDVRTLPDFLYFHGIYDKPTWETLRKCCPSDDSSNYCNYDYYITIDQNVGVIAKNFSDNSTLQDCANLVEALSFDRNWHAIYNQYNLYEDCYATEFSMNEKPTSPTGRVDFMRKYHQSMSRKESSVNPLPSVFDPLDTTANGGYSCYQYDAIANYLSLPHVRYALHVPDYVSQWEFCKDINYANLYNDTTSVFNDLLTSGYNLKVLIYNGDVDSVCSMFEAQSMINNFAHAQNLASPEPRTPWLYGQQIGGYVQKFRKDNLTIDMMTVKGAGHMVPTDRPGPILQTILNFVSGQGNYNTSIQYDLTRQPLLPQYTEQGAGTVAPVSANTTDAPITNAPVTDSVTTSTKSATNAPSTAAPPSQSTTVQAEATTLSSGNLVATITSVFFVVVSFLL